MFHTKNFNASCRPVSISPNISKIFEEPLMKQLSSFFQWNVLFFIYVDFGKGLVHITACKVYERNVSFARIRKSFRNFHHKCIKGFQLTLSRAIDSEATNMQLRQHFPKNDTQSYLIEIKQRTKIWTFIAHTKIFRFSFHKDIF